MEKVFVFFAANFEDMIAMSDPTLVTENLSVEGRVRYVWDFDHSDMEIAAKYDKEIKSVVSHCRNGKLEFRYHDRGNWIKTKIVDGKASLVR